MRIFDLENNMDNKAHLDLDVNEKILRVLYYDSDSIDLKNIVFPKE